MNLDYFLNGLSVPAPDNWQAIEFELSFESSEGFASLSTNPFIWSGENAKKINAYISQVGGRGVYVGYGFQIKACTGLTLFNGMLDLSSSDTLIECDRIVAPAIELGRIDWVRDTANSFDYSILGDTTYTGLGKINKSDYVPVPYVISAIPDYFQVMILSLTIAQIVREIYVVSKELSQLVAEVQGHVAGVSTVVGIPSSSPALGATIIKLIFFIIYVILMIILFAILLIQLINNLVQPIKYKLGMRVRTLFERGCERLGMNFSSTLLTTTPYKDLVIIPRKVARASNLKKNRDFFSNVVKGFNGATLQRDYDDAANPSAFGYFEGSFGDLVVAMSDYFNAQVRIIGNTVHFESVNYWNNPGNMTIPVIKTDSLNLNAPDPHSTNASELASNYFISYAQDGTEFNTYDQYDGTQAQASFELINKPVDMRYSLLKNKVIKRFIFASAKRKESLTIVETVLKPLLDMFDFFQAAMIGTFNAIINPINTYLSYANTLTTVTIPLIPVLPPAKPFAVSERLGMMLLEKDMFSVPKILLIENKHITRPGLTGGMNKVSPQNLALTSAEYLLKTFHATSFIRNTFVTPEDHNQYSIYKGKTIPLCCGDYLKVRDKNFLKDQKGKFARIDSLKWNPHNETAVIDYRVKEKFTTNVSAKIIVDGQ